MLLNTRVKSSYLMVGVVISGLFFGYVASTELQAAAVTESSEVLGAIERYRADLPAIGGYEGGSPAEQITHFLLKFSPLTKAKQAGRAVLTAKIDSMLGGPLKMVIKGFPFKSTSPAKCISANADLFDYLALMTLNHIAQQISTIHGPGASITLVNDGYPIAELLWP